jgi:hypothetical protein
MLDIRSQVHGMKLSAWLSIPNLDGTRKRRREFAARIGVTPTMVTEYAENRAWPHRRIMEAIVRETGGQVTADDFLSADAATTIAEAAQ